MTADSVAAWTGAVGSIVAVFGLITQAVWTSRQLSQVNALARFQSAVDGPVTLAIQKLDEFEGGVHDLIRGRQNASVDGVFSEGVRVNRAVNTAASSAARFDVKVMARWYDLDTSYFEELFDSLREENKAEICERLIKEIDRVRRLAQDLLADSRNIAEGRK
ncbi:hypothetical protein [Acidimangrovimonas sediminis]|uniref:hypothetical protein n=1 Tax=Acidimangrovimonas sediminis TaxID=2056283 RepID=UPI000C80283C|nr:hypothetical protein [Acidimangrovimonas sediminis]